MPCEPATRSKHAVHFSSKSDDWATPDDYFARLSRLFNFTLDPCADVTNAKCARYFTREDDGLSQSWQTEGAVFMNPPYGDPEHPCKRDRYGNYACKKKRCAERGHHIDDYRPGVADFVRKAYEESRRGTPVVCLLPARPDTEWWQDYCTKGLVKFVRGRLKFGDAAAGAPFPSAIVIFANLDSREPGGLL